MLDSPHNSSAPEEIDRAAAAWVVRLERGLKPAEQGELDAWLASDPRHWAALAEYRDAWQRFEPLANERARATAASRGVARNPESNDRRGRGNLRWRWVVGSTLAAAAAIALVFFLRTPTLATDSLASLTAPCERRVLEDGSVIHLDHGAIVSVNYTPGERRVTLRRGQAHFAVAKNHDRPFIVTAGGVSVRAVGTAFDVRLDSAAVAVLVTEGTVQVKKPEPATTENHLSSNAMAASPVAPLVTVGQLAIISLAPAAPAPEVATLSAADFEARSAWQPRLLNYDDAPLAVIVAAFNQRNRAHMRIDDATLGDLRMTVSIRSDNLAAFVRLLEGNFGVRAGSEAESEIVLRRK